jgi:hypothetical protein
LSTTEFPFFKFVDDDDDKTERKSFEQILQPLQQSQLSSELLQKSFRCIIATVPPSQSRKYIFMTIFMKRSGNNVVKLLTVVIYEFSSLASFPV